MLDEEYKEKNDSFLKKVPKLKSRVEIKILENDIVIVTTKNNHKLQNFFRKLGKKIPHETNMKLDDYGSFVILMINENKSIYEIGQKLKKKYGTEIEPLYERLVVYIEHLRVEKKWINY